MPLLMCPNCDASMQSVQRAGVEFDMCPRCRGVWLDRGELEKLMAMERDEAQAAQAPPSRPYSRPDHYSDHKRHEDHRRYDDDHRHHGHYGHHKKKRFDLFDIFD
jgi:Zn-finger nucleic acid-binding protein